MYLTEEGEVLYNSNGDIAGFEFDVDGTTVSGASGGDAADAGFYVSPSAGGSTVLGFSFTGATILAGCGVLTTLTLDGEATGLSGLEFVDSSGAALEFSYHGNDGDDVDDSCTSGVYDCAGVCDGGAVVDCAGDCNGDALFDECGTCDNDLANDCVQDCAGTWGGDSVDTDLDGLCDNVDECPELLGVECHDGCPTGDLNSDSLYTAADVLQMRDQYVSTGLINSLDDLSYPDDLGSNDLQGECSLYDMTGDGFLDYQDMQASINAVLASNDGFDDGLF